MWNPIKRLALFALMFAASSVESRYNILSFESAKYKAYITAYVVDFMEQYAYNTAVVEYCMPARTSKKIAMPELFDMFAGSETGAILATSLVIPNTDTTQANGGQENMYFADHLMNLWFLPTVDTLYHNSQKGLLWLQILFLIITFGLTYFIYLEYDKQFESRDYDGIFNALRWIIKEEKKDAKGSYDRELTRDKTKGHEQDIQKFL